MPGRVAARGAGAKGGSLTGNPTDRIAAATAAGDVAALIAAFDDAAGGGLTGAQWAQFTQALLDAGDSARALSISRAFMAQVAPTPGLLALAAKAALLENQPDLALRLASAAERLEPGMPGHPGIVFEALVRLGAVTEAVAALRRKAAAGGYRNLGDVMTLCSMAGLAGDAAAVPDLLARLGLPEGIPQGDPLLFVGMPKSAGATIARTVAARLGCQFTGLGIDLPGWAGFPAPCLHEGLMRLFQGRRIMLLSHAAALPGNEPGLGRFPRPIHVHMRDPRDALVSLFEMGEGNHTMQQLRFLCLRADYAALTRAQRLACLRQHVYPLYLRWIEGWLARSRVDPGGVRFSCYEDFVRDQDGMLARLAGAYGAADPAAGDVHVMHFRAGRVGGHRQAFEAQACREMFEAIPVEARDRFGWAP